MYETTNQTAPNKTALNLTGWIQTKACITVSSRETCTLLRYYTAQNGNYTPTFWDNPLAPHLQTSRHSMIEVNWHNLLFFGICPFSNCLKHNILKAELCFSFEAKKHVTWWTP